VWNSDATTVFAFLGTDSRTGEARVTSKAHHANRNARGLYVPPGGGGKVDFKSGLGVKHEVSVSAGGDVAPVFAVASGWSPHHLRKPIVVIDQPGLSAGASDARNELSGRLVLKRDGELSPEEKKLYPGGSVTQYLAVLQQEGVEEHIGCVRLALAAELGIHWAVGQPVPAELTAVHWSDGADEVLMAMVDSKLRARRDGKRTTDGKGAAGNTQGTQGLDASPIFKILKKLERSMEACAVNKALSIKLKKTILAHPDVNIPEGNSKLKDLCDHMGRFPTAMAKAASTSNVQEGFRSVGMLRPDGDGCDGDGPTFEGCMRTMFREVTAEEWCLARRNVTEGMVSVVTDGQVLEHTLDDMGWGQDQNAAGEEVLRP
jgi:hypothetical protein